MGGNTADLTVRVVKALIGPPRQASPRLAMCLMCIGGVIVLAANVSDARIALLFSVTAVCSGMTAPVVALLMVPRGARIYAKKLAHYGSNRKAGLLPPPNGACTRRG